VSTHVDETTVAGSDSTVVRIGDPAEFGMLVERHRSELRLHCYRLLGSFDDAEDLVQETFLRAWRARSSFKGIGFVPLGHDPAGSALRSWLYRIATNACRDVLRRRTFRTLPVQPPHHEVAPADSQPDAVAEARETVELAIVAAVKALPPRQRTVLVLRDLVGYSAPETATVLGVSNIAVNSALQRARTTLRRRLAGQRSDWRATQPTHAERCLITHVLDLTFPHQP
jgi:RNA polymerase sigma-70 factor, ECF subfamily